MLVIRIILFIALTANTKHDPRLSALFVGVTALPLVVLSAAGVHKNKLLNIHETSLNINMAVFVLWVTLQLQCMCMEARPNLQSSSKLQYTS